MRLPLLVAVALFAAGCATPTSSPPADTPVGAVGTMELGSGVVMHNGGTKGAISYLHLAEGDEASITFPDGVLVQDADQRLVPATEPVRLANGELVSYLPPYGVTNLSVEIASAAGARTIDLALAEGEPLVSGDQVIELMRVQEAQFPHRTPGHPSYAASMTYFQEYFEALGYEVEVSSYPEWPVALPTPSGAAPASLNSVVAYKRGTDMADRYVVFGGHFDVVEQTTHGAFDNTAGTMATLALAKAFANVTTSRTMVFAAWGGEEDCVCGSQAWLVKHPELIPFIDLYVNYDVTGLAYPAPGADPGPVVVAAGPDAAMAGTLHAQHATLETTWMQTGAPFVYDPVVEGQAGGGVHAQSDHTPFMSRGVPVVFQFPERTGEIFGYIHSEKDTLENMTKFAYGGPKAIEVELTPAEMTEGERLLARSFETQMVGGFYWALLLDAGVLDPARPSPAAGASLPSLA